MQKLSKPFILLAVAVMSVAMVFFPFISVQAFSFNVFNKSFDTVQTDTITVAGSNTWTAPTNMVGTSVQVELWGGGANGADGDSQYGGDGGGGGAYSKKTVSGLTLGQNYTVYVGAANTDSYFIDTATVLAKGGSGTTGGQASAGVGTVKYSGGNGSMTSTTHGGGGGGGAGTLANGGNASGITAGTGGNAGGGAGGAGSSSFDTDGGDGIAPGGGGGGGGSEAWGGYGAPGQAILTYTVRTYTPALKIFSGFKLFY